MEDRKDHRVRRFIGLTLVASITAATAAANHHFTWPTDIVVQTNPNEVVVEAHTGGAGGGAPGGTGTQTSGGSNCHVQGPGNIGAGSVDLVAESGGLLPYTLICDGEVVGVVWLPADGGGGGEARLRRP